MPARTTAVFRRAAQVSCAPYPRELFVRGGFNDWGNPTPTDAYRLAFLGGVNYAVSSPIAAAGTYDFKVADANWTADTNCGAGAAGGNVRLGVPQTLECQSNSGNLVMTAPAAGNYTFSLDATSTLNPVLTVERTPFFSRTTIFVRGGFNDWGNGPAPTAPLAWDGRAKYQYVIDNLPASTFDFKVGGQRLGRHDRAGRPTVGPVRPRRSPSARRSRSTATTARAT